MTGRKKSMVWTGRLCILCRLRKGLIQVHWHKFKGYSLLERQIDYTHMKPIHETDSETRHRRRIVRTIGVISRGVYPKEAGVSTGLSPI